MWQIRELSHKIWMIRSLWMQSVRMETIAIRLAIGLLASLAVGPHRKNHRCLIHRKTVNHAVSLAFYFHCIWTPTHTHLILISTLVCFVVAIAYFLLKIVRQWDCAFLKHVCSTRSIAIGCGIANKQKRIVGGQETEVNQYPWMALLTYSNRFYCGASLINDRYVMTAAHCVSGFNKDRIGVTLLEHDRSKPGETELLKRRVRMEWICIRRPFGIAFVYNSSMILPINRFCESYGTQDIVQPILTMT